MNCGRGVFDSVGFIELRTGDTFCLRAALRASNGLALDSDIKRIVTNRLSQMILEAERLEDSYSSPVMRGV